MTAQTYTGPSGALKKDSAWLSSEDFALPFSQVVQVADVELHRNVKFEAGRTEEKVGALRFAEYPKAMVLNATNRKMMRSLFTNDTKEWRGKFVTLYVDPKVRNPAGGAPVCGLRVKEAEQPRAAPAGPAFDLQALTDVGESKAREGKEALRIWWATIPPRAQHALKAKLEEWKLVASAQTAP